VIEGETGIGKTAFVHQSLSGAQGIVVLEASGDESEVSLDYGTIHSATTAPLNRPGPPPVASI
jgi:hypothetical protein